MMKLEIPQTHATLPTYVATAADWGLVPEVTEKHPPPAPRRGGVCSDRPQAFEARLTESLGPRPIRARGVNAEIEDRLLIKVA